MQQINLIESVKGYVISKGLDSKSRKQKAVYERYYLYKYIKDHTFLTLAEIGEIFDRDHATVLHGLNEFEKYKDDERFSLYCYEAFTIFPMNYTTRYNVTIGSLTLSPRAYGKLKVIKKRLNCETYAETLQKYILEKL